MILYYWWRMISYVNTVNLNENFIAVNNRYRPTSLLFRKSLVICETHSTVIVWNMSSLLCLLPTTTVLRPFIRDYPGEPVPEETLTHPPSWSSSSLYQLLPSTMIHSILPVQFTCLAIFLHNLCLCPLLSTSWSGDLHIKFHTFFHPFFHFCQRVLHFYARMCILFAALFAWFFCHVFCSIIAAFTLSAVSGIEYSVLCWCADCYLIDSCQHLDGWTGHIVDSHISCSSSSCVYVCAGL